MALYQTLPSLAAGGSGKPDCVIDLLVNTCVFSTPHERIIFPWTIMEVKEPEHTFSDFFRSTIKPKLPRHSGVEYELLSSHVGPQKSKLDPGQ